MSLHFSGMLIKIFTLSLVGMAAWFYQTIQPPPPRICGTPNGPPVESSRVRLKDGRNLSYKEWGVSKEEARRKIIYIHGFDSCKYDVPPLSKVISLLAIDPLKPFLIFKGKRCANWLFFPLFYKRKMYLIFLSPICASLSQLSSENWVSSIFLKFVLYGFSFFLSRWVDWLLSRSVSLRRGRRTVQMAAPSISLLFSMKNLVFNGSFFLRSWRKSREFTLCPLTELGMGRATQTPRGRRRALPWMLRSSQTC